MVEFEYKNGKRLKMRDSYAKILERAGMGSVVQAAPTYQTRVVKPVEVDEEISPRTGKPKRKYKRRDMSAED